MPSLVDVLTARTAGAIAAAASIGVRPTFGENGPNLEVYLLDFDGDLYGAELSVALVAYLRPELKFDGIEPLVAQMRRRRRGGPGAPRRRPADERVLETERLVLRRWRAAGPRAVRRAQRRPAGDGLSRGRSTAPKATP